MNLSRKTNWPDVAAPAEVSKKMLRLIFVMGSFAMTVSLCGQADGQAGTKRLEKQDQQKLSNPLTDPKAKTQTKALPTNQRPVTQRPRTPKQSTQQSRKQIARPTNPGSRKQVEIPKPEHLILDTSDGVRLKCTYFAPPKVETVEGEEARPVLPFILLHDWDGDRRQLFTYASFLQRAGHAAIVPDLRGHGESVQVQGVSKPIDYQKFRKQEVMSAQKDIERCKKFLVQRHNKQELNVDLLCVVAVGETSVLAVQWTLNDWFAYPAMDADGIKQGQDVKALMLVSPVKKIAGISMLQNLKHPLYTGAGGAALPMLVLWGAAEDTARESEAIAKLIEKSRPDVSKIEDDAKRLESTSFFSVPVRKYKFSGVELMEAQRVKNFWPYISNKLFEQKVVAQAENFPWVSRETKSEEDEQ